MISKKESTTKQKRTQEKPKRKAIGKKMRFDVFKRDSFACQYCGRKAPDIVLNCDHIKPVKEGGKNTMLNLVTSCFDCNSGKGARTLSDDSAVKMQAKQMAELQERKDQIDMVLKWRSELDSVDRAALDGVVARVNSYSTNYYINDSGIRDLKKTLKKHTLEHMLDCVDVAADQYLIFDIEGHCSRSSFSEFISRIDGVCRCRLGGEFESKKHYIKGILRNRLGYFDQAKFLQRIGGYADADVGLIIAIAKHADTWCGFWNRMDEGHCYE